MSQLPNDFSVRFAEAGKYNQVNFMKENDLLGYVVFTETTDGRDLFIQFTKTSTEKIGQEVLSKELSEWLPLALQRSYSAGVKIGLGCDIHCSKAYEGFYSYGICANSLIIDEGHPYVTVVDLIRNKGVYSP